MKLLFQHALDVRKIIISAVLVCSHICKRDFDWLQLWWIDSKALHAGAMFPYSILCTFIYLPTSDFSVFSTRKAKAIKNKESPKATHRHTYKSYQNPTRPSGLGMKIFLGIWSVKDNSCLRIRMKCRTKTPLKSETSSVLPGLIKLAWNEPISVEKIQKQ